MRQYWRDFDSLERWAHYLPHKAWWRDYLRDRAGTGFWHETYFRDGAVESVVPDSAFLPEPRRSYVSLRRLRSAPALDI
jgi:hypothetical protein